MASVGSYELEAELGRGGMGRVYRARHGPLGALRAVKVVTAAVDADTAERFRREAAALARVAGNGVVPIHDSGTEGGKLWFSMDLLEGGSLGGRLAKVGKLDWRQAASMAVEVARVLARCHAAGIVHRDVKPDNVLLDLEGRPWLADFGCVRDLGASRLTETGTVLGTLAYMAPEQLDGRPVDAGADVYALAALLHELVAGTPPFGGGGNVLSQMRARRAPRPRLGKVGAPDELDEILDRALAFDPARRTTGASVLARELEGLLRSSPRAMRASRRRRLVVGLVGAVFALLAVGIGIAWKVSRDATRLEIGAALEDVARVESSLARAGDAAFVGSMTIDDGAVIQRARDLVERSLVMARRASRMLLPDGVFLLGRAAELGKRAERLGRARVACRELASGRVEDAERALGPADGDPVTTLVRARILLAGGDARAAAGKLEEIVSAHPTVAVYELLGDALFAVPDPAGAHAAYARACEIEKTGPRLVERACSAIQSGRYAEGFHDLEALEPASLPDRARRLARFATLVYEIGVDRHDDKLLDLAWRLSVPDEKLRPRVVQYWLDRANKEAGASGIEVPRFDDRSVRETLKKAIEVAHRAAILDPEADLAPVWAIAGWIRTRDRAQTQKSDDLTLELFESWPDHPVSVLARARRDATGDPATLALVLGAIERLPPLPPEGRLDSGEVPSTANALCTLCARLALEDGPGKHRLTRPQIERLVSVVERTGAASTAGSWVRLGLLLLDEGDVKGARRCIDRARNTPLTDADRRDVVEGERRVREAETSSDR